MAGALRSGRSGGEDPLDLQTWTPQPPRPIDTPSADLRTTEAAEQVVGDPGKEMWVGRPSEKNWSWSWYVDGSSQSGARLDEPQVLRRQRRR